MANIYRGWSRSESTSAPLTPLESRLLRVLRVAFGLLTLVLCGVAVWKFCAGRSLEGLFAVCAVWILFRLVTR